MLDLLFAPKRKAAAQTEGGWASWGVASLFSGMFGGKTRSGVTITAEAALTYSPVWAAGRILSEIPSSLPLFLYRRLGQEDGREMAGDHPLYEILHSQPNPDMGSKAFRAGRHLHQAFWGNGFAEIEWDSPNPARRTKVLALWPIHPARVKPLLVGQRNNQGQDLYDQGYRYLVRNDDGTAVAMRPDEMLHFPGLMPEDGIWGKGIIAYARETIGYGMATDNFSANFFGTGGMPRGIIFLPGMKDREARKSYRTEWKEVHGGPDGETLAILPVEGKFEQIKVSNQDAELVQSRKLNVVDIARFTGIPVYMLEEYAQAASYASVEMRGLEYISYSLLPWLKSCEEQYNLKVLLPSEREKYYVEHELAGLLRGDIATRYAAYQVGLTNGWLTHNEVRKMENLNPMGEAGDKHFFPMNMTTVELAGEPPEPPPPPPSPFGMPPGGNGLPSPEEEPSPFGLVLEAESLLMLPRPEACGGPGSGVPGPCPGQGRVKNVDKPLKGTKKSPLREGTTVKGLAKKAGVSHTQADAFLAKLKTTNDVAELAKAAGTTQAKTLRMISEARPPEHWGGQQQPYWRPGANPTVDNVITRGGTGDQEKQVLLIQRGKDPESGKWALPGGFHDSEAGKGEPWKPGKESSRDAALRELKEETGLTGLKGTDLRTVGTYEGGGRDPRDNGEAWSRSSAFRFHLPDDVAVHVKGGDDARAAKWVPVSKLPGMRLAFDHRRILNDAGVKAGAGRGRGGKKAEDLAAEVASDVLQDTLGRLLKREADAVSRHARRPDFEAWLADFHREHEPRLAQALSPAVRVLQCAGVEVLAPDLAAQIIADSAAELRRAYNADTPAQFASRLGTWSGRTKALTQRLLADYLPLEECGGPGSGVPGPCPGPQKDKAPADKDKKGDDKPADKGAKPDPQAAASHAVSQLAAPTKTALAPLHQEAAAKGDQVMQDLVNKPGWKGPTDPAVVGAALKEAYDKAEITINFKPQDAHYFAADPNLRNAYETGSRKDDPTYMQTRQQQEDAVFGAGKGVPNGDRPKYAAVNWTGNVYGAAQEYGHASFVLNKDALGGRSTMTPANSFGHRNSSMVGTPEDPHAAIGTAAALRAAGLPHDSPGLNKGYTEVQIWGGVKLDKDTVKEIRMPSLKAGEPGVDKLKEFADREGIPMKFFHEQTGKGVDYETARAWSAERNAASKTSGLLGRIGKFFGLGKK